LVNWWRIARQIMVGVLAMTLLLGASIVVKARTAPVQSAVATTRAGVDAVVSAASPAVVGVTGRRCGESTAGSGIVVANRIVTSRHLVAGEMRVDTADPDLDRRLPPVVVVGSSVRFDLALSERLEAADQRRGWSNGLELAPSDAQPGQPVTIVARIGGQIRWMAARVQLMATGPQYGVEGMVLVLDAPVGPGWSGGPVLDEAGRIVGLTRAVDRTTGLTLAAPRSELDQWLGNVTNVDAQLSC
jgi:S1-C subfamily serine protease